MSTFHPIQNIKCMICEGDFTGGKKFTNHLQKVHKYSSYDYTVKYIYGGIVPSCPLCDQQPRYVSLSFKKYCKEHSHEAEREAGKVGGKIKTQWNKGKTKETDTRVAALAIKCSGEGNPFFGKFHTQETKNVIADKKRLDLDEVIRRIEELNLNIDFSIDSDVYQERQLSLIRVKCKTCSTGDNVTLFNLERCWRCKSCFPLASRQQLEIADFIKATLGINDVEVSTRKIIPPLELDIWVPNKKFAVEYHGLYWHSGGREETFDKKRHREKLLACRAADIRLFQFFEDEWRDKRTICESMIRNALGANLVLLNARDCEIKIIDTKISKPFLDSNHIGGSTRATHHLGLFHKTAGLVGVATIRTPIQKKWGRVSELARMAFCQNTTVRGGASKLLSVVKSWSKIKGFEGVLSYAELRYGTGGVYQKCGFELVGEVGSNYWYAKDGQRFDRFKYRAQPGKSENQVAEEAKVRAVWGCGNKVYLFKF